MRINLVMILVSIMLITACTPNGTGEGENSGYPRPGQESLPSPVVENPGGIPYPEYKEGDSISVNVAVTLLQSGSVDKINLVNTNEAIFFLKDGRTLKITAPYENAVSQWIEQCGEPCKDIQVVKE